MYGQFASTFLYHHHTFSHDIIEILLKVALSTTKPTKPLLSAAFGKSCQYLCLCKTEMCILFVPCPYSTTIDHNPSSTISTSSFHGTGISIFQHPAGENDGAERDVMIFKTDKPTTNQIPELPDEYTNMKPASLKSKPVPPGSTIQFVGIQNHEYLT